MNAQQQAALDTHVHCAVLANAGAGKTQVLVQRFLRILVLENVEIDSVVAITFTRAAAMEMRQRLHHLIESILSGSEDPTSFLGTHPPAQLESRLHRLRLQIGAARISTFHSFCAGLVRQYADVVGRSSDVRDADEKLCHELCLEAVDATMQHFLAAEKMRDHRIQTVFDSLSIDTIQATVASMTRSSADRRKLLQVLSEPIDAALERRRTVALNKQAEQMLRLAAGLLVHLAPFTQLTEIDHVHNQLRTLKQRMEGGDEYAYTEFQTTLEEWLTQDLTIRKKKLGKVTSDEALPEKPSEDLISLAETIRVKWNDEAELHQLHVIHGLAMLCERAAREYSEIKRRRNVMDFDDMIDDATRLLSNPEIAPAVRGSISHIMIDEFQDTDPTQFQLLELLAPALRNGTSDGPNVFVVGDDKQSIYGFRNADVRLFRRARRVIKRANMAISPKDDGLRPMTQSFRMHQDLADCINTICRRTFGSVTAPDENDDLSFDVAYMDLTAAIERPSLSRLSSTTLLEVSTEDLTVGSEYEHLASLLVEMLRADGGVEVFERTIPQRAARPGDIAVLVPSNDDKNLVADALRRRGLPYTIYSGRSFFSRPEVADVRAALSAAVDPSNDLATATALRSPLLRCPDIDIVRASLRGRKSSLQDGLTDLVNAGEASAESIAAVRFFNDLRAMISLRPLSEVIEPMLQHCGWHAAVATDPRYDQMVANIDKLIDICTQAEQHRSASLADVLDAIREPKRDLEAEGTVMSNDNAIHIMTIHASKGLEFPIVAMAGLSTSSKSESFIISEQIGPSMSTPQKVVPVNDALTTVSRSAVLSHITNQILDAERREAERRRLLYVALTRAKAHLVIALPRSDDAKSAKGLARLLIDATVSEGPWQRVACTTERQSAVYHASELAARPIVQPFAPLAAPDPVILTASMLRRRSSSTSGITRRRIFGADSSSTIYGTAVHEALAEVIRSAHATELDHAVEDIVCVMKRHDLDRETAKRAINEVVSVLDHPLVRQYGKTLESCVIEGALMAMHRESIIEGVLDVRFRRDDGTVEVWDWKTNLIRSEEHLHEVAESYAAQMQTYAWLCAKSLPECNRVVTRLIFTKAAAEGHATIDVSRQWDNDGLSLPDDE